MLLPGSTLHPWEKTERQVDMAVLRLIEEIQTARTLHHALVASDAIFHLRLLGKRVVKEVRSDLMANGFGEQEVPEGARDQREEE